MAARIEFFPVDNGDMTLITLDSGRTILIDCKIRAAADDEADETPDVAKFLRERIGTDADGRPFVDVFVLTHPDQDHCSGLEAHFHLGKLSSRSKKTDTIVIREMWSSPIVFRRKARIETMCGDAEAWCKEARRRVQAFRDGKGAADGERILILGHDVDHKTDGLEDILISVDEDFSRICGEPDESLLATLLGPLDPHDNEDEEELLAKNRSSVILQLRLSADGVDDACLFLCGGDAGVAIWERQWQRLKNDASSLKYHVLLTPHHCSLHSLSEGSWSEDGEKVKISADALAALSQALEGAYLVASSKHISDDDSDPPCVRAQREYVKVAKNADGKFTCVADHVADENTEVLRIDITDKGRQLKKFGGSNSSTSIGLSMPAKTDKRGGGRSA